MRPRTLHMRDRLARITAAYAFCHVVVDLACVTTVLGWAAPFFGLRSVQHSALAILAYDLVAFCFQLPLGALLDALGRRQSRRAAMASFALVAAGVSAGWAGADWLGFVPAAPIQVAAGLLVALGNALFHCAGGVEVLGESDGRAAPSGMFISTGALGVFVGGLTAFNGWRGTPVLLLVLLVACAAAVLWAPSSDEPGELQLAVSPIGWAAVALLAMTVALRSYTGMVMAFPWKTEFALALTAILAVVAGKAVGGCVSDVLGAPLTSAFSLGVAALLFPFAHTSVAAGLAATFLFNFTMAITLSALAGLMPQAHGLAFGLASFALAMGALPALLGLRATSGGALAILSLASLIFLELGLMLARRTHSTSNSASAAGGSVRVDPARLGRHPRRRP